MDRPAFDAVRDPRTCRTIRTGSNDRVGLPAEGNAGRAAPVIEAAGVEALEILEILERADVPQVAAEPDVIRRKPHRAAAKVEAPFVAVDIEQVILTLH